MLKDGGILFTITNCRHYIDVANETVENYVDMPADSLERSDQDPMYITSKN